MKWFVAAFLALAFIVAVVWAELSPASDLPYFYLPPTAQNLGPVTESQAQTVAADLTSLYAIEVYQQTKRPLWIHTDWPSPYFGAGMNKKENYILIEALGGFARVPEMTTDILAATFCHELGHILAGPPYQSIAGLQWTSVEGQADFFAAAHCLPRYFQRPGSALLTTAELKNKITQTALGLFLLGQKYSGQKNFSAVSLEATAPEKATKVQDAYPSEQCRLDTYKAGAECLTSKTCKAPACWLPE